MLEINQKKLQHFIFFIEKYKVTTFNNYIIKQLCDIASTRNIDKIESFIESNAEEFKKNHNKILKELEKIDVFI